MQHGGQPGRRRQDVRVEVGRDREAVAKAVQLIEQAEEPPRLSELADAVGYAEHHFQRIFTRDMGVSPAAYARAIRARTMTPQSA